MLADPTRASASTLILAYSTVTSGKTTPIVTKGQAGLVRSEGTAAVRLTQEESRILPASRMRRPKCWKNSSLPSPPILTILLAYRSSSYRDLLGFFFFVFSSTVASASCAWSLSADSRLGPQVSSVACVHQQKHLTRQSADRQQKRRSRQAHTQNLRESPPTFASSPGLPWMSP